jgi:hypothetical protein
MPGREPPGGRGGRLLWFVLFYGLSLLAFTGLVYAIRVIARGG